MTDMTSDQIYLWWESRLLPLLAAVLLGFIIGAYSVLSKPNKKTTKDAPKPPYGVGLVEQAKDMMSGSFAEIQLGYSKKWGSVSTVQPLPFFPLNFLIPDQIMIADPKVALDLLTVQQQQRGQGKKVYTQRDDFMTRAIQEGEGPSIAGLIGPEWKWRKDALMKEFHKKRLFDNDRGLMSKIVQYCQEMCDSLEEAASGGVTAASTTATAPAPAPIKVHNLTMRFTIQTIFWFLFGESSEKLEYEYERVHKAGEDMIYHVMYMFMNPFHHILKHFFKASHAQEKSRDDAWNYMDQVLDSEVKRLFAMKHSKDAGEGVDGSSSSAFESMFQREPRFSKQGMERFKADARLLTLAGSETTGHAIGFCLGMLAERPDIGDRIRQEAIRAFGNPRGLVPDERGENMASHITPDRLEACPTAKGLFMEALRLHPPVTSMGGVMLEDHTVTTTEGKSYLFPKGYRTTYLITALNRHEKHVHGSGDPEAIEPERWSKDNKKELPFLGSFNLGTHACPGKPLGTLEAHVALLMICSRFEFRFPEGIAKVESTERVLLKPRDGMPLLVKKRP